MIYLARHGETDDNARGVVQGWIDTPLNDRGREQARELARAVADLGDVAAVWTSQLARASETAQIVGDAIGVEPRVDERLSESRRGSWEGRTLDEIEASEHDAWAAWKRAGADFRFPGGGESLAEHQQRVLAALANIARGPLPAVAIAHGGTLRCAICTQRPGGLDEFWSIPVPNAELVTFDEAALTLPVTRVRTPPLAAVAFALLAAATLAAFFVTQRLKDSDPVVKRIATPLFVSPNDDGRKDTARISLELPKADRVTVAIVTAGGDEKRRLIDDRSLGRGRHTANWDGRDTQGAVMRDGSYYVRVSLRRQGRSVTAPRPIRLETTPPRPRLQSVLRLRDGKVRLRYSGPASPPPLYTVYRTEGGRAREIARFFGSRGENVHVWDGFVGLRRLPPGDYAFGVTVQNKALVAGSSPVKLPPARELAAPRTGVSFNPLDLAPPLEPVRSGAVARVRVGGPSRRFRWKLTRLNSIRPLRRGTGSGHRLAFRVPPDAPTGVYTLAVVGAGHRATAPIAVRAGGASPVLVVLPAIAWQGRNAVDGDIDGFTETLDDSRAVGAGRPLADGRPPAGFVARVAPLMRFLGRRDYDLTTDLALARGRGPGLRSYQGLMFVGDERWLPSRVNRRLRSYVEGGGKIASFGTDSFRRRLRVTRSLLRDPSRPERTNVFGERTSPSRSEAAPLVRERDTLKLFTGTDGLVGLWESFEVSDGLAGSARFATAAGREPGKPAFVGYRLGKGVVVRVGVPGWAGALEDGEEEATVTRRIWALLSR